MPTIEEWRTFYDGWSGKDPAVASTGIAMPEQDFVALGTAIAGQLALGGRETVLDVGCASATLTSRWAAHAARVVGIDFSARLVSEARMRHANRQIAFAVAEAGRLPFEAASFDAVVCFNVLLSLPDHDAARRAIREVLRVARPGARIVLGSLPDVHLKSRFFAHLAAVAPWHRRLGTRVKNVLLRRRVHSRPTRILWFDVDALVRELERAGCRVEVHDDPRFANYHIYRKTLVVVAPVIVEVGV